MIQESMDNAKVAGVCAAYMKGVKALYGRIVNIKLPANGTVSFRNCMEFYKLYEEREVSLDLLMVSALQRLPADWCMKVFHIPHAPFGVTVSAASRRHAASDIPPVASTTDEWDKYQLRQLRGLPVPSLKALVAGGLLQTMSDHVKVTVQKWLEEEA